MKKYSIIMLILTLCSTSMFARENVKTWKLGDVVESHGEIMLGLNPFPEYFKIIESEKEEERVLVVKMRNQGHEKKYVFKLNSSTVNNSVQTYEKSIIEFNELAIVQHHDRTLVLKFEWTRDDKEDFITKGEYKLTIRDDGDIDFIRYNGKSSVASYFEFKANYVLE